MLNSFMPVTSHSCPPNKFLPPNSFLPRGFCCTHSLYQHHIQISGNTLAHSWNRHQSEPDGNTVVYFQAKIFQSCKHSEQVSQSPAPNTNSSIARATQAKVKYQGSKLLVSTCSFTCKSLLPPDSCSWPIPDFILDSSRSNWSTTTYSGIRPALFRGCVTMSSRLGKFLSVPASLRSSYGHPRELFQLSVSWTHNTFQGNYCAGMPSEHFPEPMLHWPRFTQR